MPDTNQSSLAERQRIDRLVQLIWNDQRLRIQSGEFVRSEEYLDDFPEVADNTEASVDVVYNEFLLRSELSGTPDESDYYERFPNLAPLLKRQVRVNRGIAAHLIGQSSPDDALSIPDASTRYGEATRTRSLESTVTSDVEAISNGERDDRRPQRIGRYELGREIGRGSFSIVYRGWDRELDRLLAIKLPRAELIESPNIKARMLREARSAAKLFHPAIVQVHEIGEHQGMPFIATDYIDGPTLEQSLSRDCPAFSVAANWIASLADALHYAHQNGVTHRDVKPANIIENGDGQLMITDFGLAQLADSAGSITQHGDIVGTPSYMSPEQAEGMAVVDFRADIYSLGVILYRCLTGRLPFTGPISSILHQVVHEPVETLGGGDRKIPRDLEIITLKCLSKNPAARYQSAATLADDLRRFLRDEAILARPVGAFEKLVKHIRRHPRISALAITSLVLLGFVLGGAVQLGNVIGQRDRAQNAESQMQTLLATASFDAGRLAKQRGQMRSAIRHFGQSLERGKNVDPTIARLQLAECHIALGELAEAQRHLELAAELKPETDDSAEIVYWKCELALQGATAYGEALELIEQVPLRQLPADQRAFLQGMKSGYSREALEHFRSALQDNPYHHSARRSLVVMELALARFDQMLREVQIAQQLYPEDIDFLLLEALAHAATGNLDRSKDLINSIGFEEATKIAWINFCERISHVSTKLKNEDAVGDFSFAHISDLVEEFRQEHLPLIRSRRWHFPPLIARLFVELPKIEPAMEHVQWASIKSQTAALADRHPEGALSTLAARIYVSDMRDTVDDLEKSRGLFQNALNFPSFLSDTHHHARMGVCATTLKLAFVRQHEIEKNLATFAGAIAEISPDTIRDPDHLRTFTLALINSQRWALAKDWSHRWSDLTAQSNKQQVDALWHYGIVLEHDQKWLELVDVCDRLLKLDPERADAQGLRDRAVSELRQVASIDSAGDQD